jgi:ferredoxin
MIDGKARLISDLFCDGLGACLGHCPVGAITIEEREAEPYNEKKVMANIVKHGTNTILAHLEHLESHGEEKLLAEALEYLEEEGIHMPEKTKPVHAHHGSCPGAAMRDFSQKSGVAGRNNADNADQSGERPSELKQWPVQLHLVPPNAPYFKGKDVVLAADCVAFSLGDFHKDYLKGKALAIACPKLDHDQEIYAEKITQMIDNAKINTLTVMIMEVPCCGGLLRLAQQAAQSAKRKIPIKVVVVGIQGNILEESWV